MYVASDPRASLTRAAPGKAANHPPPAIYAHFDRSPPMETTGHARSWYARGENFVVSHSEVTPGASFSRTGQPDEFMVLLPDAACGITVEWQGQRLACAGYSVVFVPPGDSRIEVTGTGRVVRFFTTRATDLVALCPPGYAPDRNIPPLQPWPDPPDGHRPRAYSLDVAPQPGRFGRIFRSTTFMVNYIPPRHGPRDRSALSPHSHDDFQQCSLCLEGSYVHHLRWPWVTDADQWREDDHIRCGAPSVAVIPARVIHTSEAADPGINMLVDVFCPPRLDFSQQPGWVLNAADYPLPPGEERPA